MEKSAPSIILNHWCVTWQGHHFLCRNLSNIKILNRRNGYTTLDLPLTLGDLTQYRLAHGLSENLMALSPYSWTIPFLVSSSETPGIELLPKQSVDLRCSTRAGSPLQTSSNNFQSDHRWRRVTHGVADPLVPHEGHLHLPTMPGSIQSSQTGF
nr:unknown protein [synthetic construct]